MLNQPLLISGLLQHDDENHGDNEIRVASGFPRSTSKISLWPKQP
jgi:hypothetical protein